MHFTPTDLLNLENLAIERLQLEFPRPLFLCDVYIEGRTLAIDCPTTDALERLQDILRILAYRAWEVLGAKDILVTLQDSEEMRVETRKKIAGSGCNGLLFDHNPSECNYRLMQTLVSPTTVIEASLEMSQPVTLLYREDLEKSIAETTGLNLKQIQEAVEASGTQRYLLSGREALPATAGVQILAEFFERAQMALLGKAPAIAAVEAPVVEKPPAKKIEQPKSESNGMSMKRTRVTASRKVADKTNGVFKDLKLNLADYTKTIGMAMELVAPGDAVEQQKIAKAMAEDPKNEHMVALLKKYKDRDKLMVKVQPKLIEHLNKFAAKAVSTAE